MASTQVHPSDSPHSLPHLQTQAQPPSTPLELNNLPPQRHDDTEALYTPSQVIQQPPAAHLQAIFSPDAETHPEFADTTASLPTSSSPVTTARPTTRPRAETEAIGPSSDEPVIAVDPTSGPAVLITLLLITGARHPYKIDEKYLKKRNVTTTGEVVDPFAISVYTMKELIWRDWREEWEVRPTSPGSIRLIHFGKLLDDKNTLKESRFSDATPNVVHMTVKPQDLVDEEENTKGGKGSGRDGRDSGSSPGCRCAIM